MSYKNTRYAYDSKNGEKLIEKCNKSTHLLLGNRVVKEMVNTPLYSKAYLVSSKYLQRMKSDIAEPRILLVWALDVS